jgi:peptidoglycan-N-acetylglucosamine deacetylase
MLFDSAEHILTVDVEDNFTAEELVNPSDWVRYEGQVVQNTEKILDILARFEATATFFVVGKVAKRYPELIRDIESMGHEVASHSYAHLPYKHMNPEEIEEDIHAATVTLNALTERPIIGYRVMGFSIPKDEDFYHRLLSKNGIKYDSSKMPACQAESIALLEKNEFKLYNIYPSKMTIFGKLLPFSGGTYMRLLPYWIIERGFEQYQALGQPVVVYIHPWEFNRDQPKRKVGVKQKILQSPVTYNTERKIEKLLSRYRFTSIREFLDIGHLK